MSKAKVNKPKSTNVAATTPKLPSHSRTLELPKRIWYKPHTWSRHLAPPIYPTLPKASHMLAESSKLLWQQRKVFGGIALTYIVVSFLLVRGFANSGNLTALRDAVNSGTFHNLASQLGYLFSTAGSSSSSTGSVYQTLLVVVTSLAIIWTLRQVNIKQTVTTKLAFYRGMYPLIPFILVLLFMSLQLLPLSIGGFFYASLIGGGIAVTGTEQFLAIVITFAFIFWSLYLITSTLFAFYIVTLPDMTPLRALRSAKKLVFKRRLIIWRKAIFLPAIIVLAIVVVETPLIMFATFLAPWVFFAMTAVAIPVAHAYVYTLYRELLRDE